MFFWGQALSRYPQLCCVAERTVVRSAKKLNLLIHGAGKIFFRTADSLYTNRVAF